MKRSYILITSVILFIILAIPIKTSAEDMSSYKNIIIYTRYGYYYIGGANGEIDVDINNRIHFQTARNASQNETYFRFNTFSEALNYLNTGSYFRLTNSSSVPVSEITFCVCVKGSITYYGTKPDDYYDSLQDYENALNPPLTWYQEMWETLKEELGNPAFWFGQWFIDIIDEVFGNDENDPTGPPKPPNSTHVQINNPTLTPAPTPQPYSTVIIPKTDPVTGDTYYETNYYYNNPSGTPIIQPYPPTQSPSTNSPSGGDNYIPVGGDPYSIPIVNWLTSAKIGDSNYDGIDSVSSGLDSIDSIGSDYNDGMSAVQDSTGTLPTSWLLLIGVAAAIPLIAGIISRLLS